MNSTLRLISILLAASLMVACQEEVDDPTDPTQISDQPSGCTALDGQSYYSESLMVGGATLEGTGYNYWQVGFRDGQMTVFYTDVGEVVDYHCADDGQLVLSSSHMGPLTFSDDWQTLYFNPRQGEPITYRQFTPDRSEVSRCLEVRGNHYGLAKDMAVSSGGAIPIETPFFNFGDGTRVEFALGDGGTQMGYYSCQLGVLRVHRDLEDTAPMEIEVQDNGRLVWQREDGELEFEKQDLNSPPIGGDPVACPDIYQPVCGVVLDQVQCLTAPCPSGFYQTFGNSCNAEVQGAKVVFEDACGSLEGEPFFEDEPSCDANYDPVCGAAVNPEPCHEAPCPATVHTTFSNSCTAEVSGAPVMFEGECGEAEGTRVTALEGACPAVWEPVCGLIPEPDLACVTEPCPSHKYHTLGNACWAELSLASVAFEGECGALENTLTMGEPPVALSADLPQTQKSPAIASVEIEGDILSLELGYSGCSPQHFSWYVNPEFKESFPVQVAHSFVPQVEDACLAAFQTRFIYDLRPLKHAYQEAYQTESGEISIPDIGIYRF